MTLAGLHPEVVEQTGTICPACLAASPGGAVAAGVFVAGELVVAAGRVWLRRTCPTHGETVSLYEEDAELWRARFGWDTPPRQTAPDQPGHRAEHLADYQAGLPEGHGQHTCILVLNVTDRCNLVCPTCYAAAGEGPRVGGEPSLTEILHAVRTAIAREGGQLDVLMLSGGEPTVRGDLPVLLDRLAALPITRLMLNTNGRRLATDDRLLRALAAHRRHLEIYLQFDGLRPATYEALRGADLAAEKRAALARLQDAGLYTTLVMTVQRGVNEDEVGEVVRVGLAHPRCAGLAIQPAFGSGRAGAIDPCDRVTPTGVMRRLAAQTDGLLGPDDFIPLPCSHRDCCDLAYLVRGADDHWASVVSLVGREALPRWLPLLSNTVTFEHLSVPVLTMLREGRAPELDGADCGLNQACCCSGGLTRLFDGLRRRVLSTPALLPAISERAFRITCKMFMDAHRFHEARLRRCCVHTSTFEPSPRRHSFCWRWLFADEWAGPQQESV